MDPYLLTDETRLGSSTSEIHMFKFLFLDFINKTSYFFNL